MTEEPTCGATWVYARRHMCEEPTGHAGKHECFCGVQCDPAVIDDMQVPKENR